MSCTSNPLSAIPELHVYDYGEVTICVWICKHMLGMHPLTVTAH